MSPAVAIMETGADAVSVLAALKAAGWIVVRHDAIRLAQAMAADEAREKMRGMD
jgi:hypothetical protein